MGADNQQERPNGIASYYITGFVDGEGCFSVTIYTAKQKCEIRNSGNSRVPCLTAPE